jgi:hypothetical protein
MDGPTWSWDSNRRYLRWILVGSWWLKGIISPIGSWKNPYVGSFHHWTINALNECEFWFHQVGQGLKDQNIQRGLILANLENNSFQGPNRTNYLGGKQQMIMLVKQTCAIFFLD